MMNSLRSFMACSLHRIVVHSLLAARVVHIPHREAFAVRRSTYSGDMSRKRSPLLDRPGAVEADGLDAGVAAHYGSDLREQLSLIHI